VTWYAWLKNEGFKGVVEAQREAVVSEALNRLKAAVKGAVEGMTAPSKSLLRKGRKEKHSAP